MRRHTVIPDHNRARRPLDAGLEVLALGNVVVQKVEQEVALLLLEAHDASAELRVDEECFFARCRVRAYQRVDRGYGVAADDAAAVAGVVCLFDCWEGR